MPCRAILSYAVILCGAGTIQVGCRPLTAGPDDLARSTLISARPAAGNDDDGRVGIIIDIDETISITDYPSLVFRVGTDDSQPYENARTVLTELGRHFAITYLTSRPQWLTGETRKWLTQQGFPPGTVLTTARMVDVYWPGSFKKRAIAALRRTSPNLLIGIGDRHTDVEAYLANEMLALVVNPRRGIVYHEHAEVLKDWREIGAFFEEQAATLRDPEALRARYNVGGPSLDPSTLRTQPEPDLSLILDMPLLAPTLLIEGVVKLELAHEQAEALRALEQANVSIADLLPQVVSRFGEGHLLELRLATEDNAPVYIVTFARNGKIYEIELDSTLETLEGPEPLLLLGDGPVQARRLARMSFADALGRALREVEGQVYEIELEMDDGRATYEITLLALGRFMEVEIDARTGEVLEIEDETAAW